MNCPACQTTLSPLLLLQTEVDRCLSCGGVWLDEGELKTLVPLLRSNPDLPPLEAKIIFEKPQAALHAEEQSKQCPRCEKAMSLFNYGYNSNILLDRCPLCRGLWFDAGELMRTAQYLKGNPTLDRMTAAMAEHVEEMDAAKNRREKMAEWTDSMATSAYDGNGFGALVNALLFLLRRLRY